MNHQIKKMMFVAHLKIKEEKNFSLDFLLSFIVVAVQSLIYYLVFTRMFLDSSKVDANEIVLYFMIINVISISYIPAQYVAWKHMEDINNGTIITYILRPNNYVVYQYVQCFSSFFVRYAVNIGVVFIMQFILGRTVSIIVFFMGFLSGIFGFTILYLLQAIIGCMTVWFHDILRFRDVVFTLLLVLGGRLLPSKYLVGSLKRIIYYTPLPYVYDAPTNMLLDGNASTLLYGQIFWIAVLGALYFFLFEKFVAHNIEYGS